MEEDFALENWLGKTVGVEFVRHEEDEEPTRGSLTLRGADGRGVILSYYHEEDLARVIRFFPWHRIEWIHLSDN